ncbi:MAG: hypothetical protein P0Y66_06535 [Candidatus Kaistia colombiensis]|nr:MAG: hypothetical protein P0Y66_06535 [Kaistia sp.]
MNDELSSVSFISPKIDFPRRIKGDVYLAIASEDLSLSIGNLIVSWNLFERNLNCRIDQIRPGNNYHRSAFNTKIADFLEAIGLLSVPSFVSARLGEVLERAKRAKMYRDAVAHRHLEYSMDFRGGCAYPALYVEIGAGSSKQKTYLTVSDLDERANDLLHAGGLLSNLDLGISGAWQAVQLGECEKIALTEVFAVSC